MHNFHGDAGDDKERDEMRRSCAVIRPVEQHNRCEARKEKTNHGENERERERERATSRGVKTSSRLSNLHSIVDRY